MKKWFIWLTATAATLYCNQSSLPHNGFTKADDLTSGWRDKDFTF